MKRTVELALIFMLSLSFAISANAGNEELSSAQIKKFKSGIFEVVTRKLIDNTTYKTEFPHDLIPFHIRNDQYYSVGTAFLIKDKTFVSAAHVFNVEYRSLLSNGYAVRDDKGKLFTITNVEKYSNYRDLIQFTVKEQTDNYHKFTLATHYEEGDVVYAAGNALGEGVIFRKGSLTSFTYEPINGQWKDIRYSAAASPGNSGGPLMNLAGEVVGIVTKKSTSENLNYALPISEFKNAATDNAEFLITKLGEAEATQQLRYSWKFKTTLPKSMQTLRSEATTSFYQRFVDARQEFETKFSQAIFPAHNNVFKYFKNQENSDMLSIIDINGNGEWFLFKPANVRQVKIAKNKNLYFSQSDKLMGSYQFVLEKPEGINLLEFINDKKSILDTFLTSMQWNRKIANSEVYITSYGEPVSQETRQDKYGRVWQMAIWHDQYSDKAIMLYCLPAPAGVACDFVATSTGWIEVQQVGYADNLHRIMLSYSAKLKHWQEFMALPQVLLPKHFRTASLSLSEQAINFSFGEFSGKMQGIKLTEDSELYVTMEVNPDNNNQLMVGNLNFTPNSNEEGKYYVSKFYNQGEHASDNYNDFWNKFTSLKSPYNFEVINEGKLLSKQMNLGANHKGSKQISVNQEHIGYLAGCKLQSDIKIEEFNTLCDAFINGFN